ncbi:MAG TPA: 6-carboxytetrahydropterin synthase, partial [Candidatus Competibacteraceae bacterium]|nr:6-carboxytetrahydropterin synthase [Candidatus Competibacteraceae bacterium]
RIWKEQSFESAVRLVQAPAGDRRRCLHGHSYRVRLHLTAPLDAVLGWTIDYGEVKALFQPLYARLDHQRLDELEGLAQAASGTLAEWIRARLAAALPALDRIDLWETPERGVSLCWGGPAPVVPG